MDTAKIQEYKDDRFSMKIENDIIHVVWLKEYIDEDFVDAGIKIRLTLTENKTYPMFSDIRLAKNGSRKARERLSKTDGAERVSAVAVLVSSNVHKVLFNFFNSIYKAPAPTKIFTDKEQALEWLEQYKK